MVDRAVDRAVEGTQDEYEVVLDESVVHGSRGYRRILVRTPWFTGPTDLAQVLRAGLGEHTGHGTAFLCEKLAIVATGRTVAASTVKVGRAARFLARCVRPVGDNLGESIPERMQFVIDRIGWARTLIACAAAALTRPFRLRGAFFLVAGREARDLDGMHYPYEGTLLPPLKPHEARRIVAQLAAQLGCPVAIVDINDLGGRIRAVSSGGLRNADLMAALGDNPMGHSIQRTPIGLVALVS